MTSISGHPQLKKAMPLLVKASGSYENPDYKIPLPHNECSPFYCKHIIPPILNWLNYYIVSFKINCLGLDIATILSVIQSLFILSIAFALGLHLLFSAEQYFPKHNMQEKLFIELI